MSTFVLVPGGWWYGPLPDRIETDRHTALPLTLAGLEDQPTCNS